MTPRPRFGSALGSTLLVAAACYLLVGFSQGFVLSAWSWRTWVGFAIMVTLYPGIGPPPPFLARTEQIAVRQTTRGQ